MLTERTNGQLQIIIIITGLLIDLQQQESRLHDFPPGTPCASALIMQLLPSQCASHAFCQLHGRAQFNPICRQAILRHVVMSLRPSTKMPVKHLKASPPASFNIPLNSQSVNIRRYTADAYTTSLHSPKMNNV